MPPNVVFGPAAGEAPEPPASPSRKRWYGIAVVTALLMLGGLAAGSGLGVTDEAASNRIRSAVLPMADDAAGDVAAVPEAPGPTGSPAASTTTPTTAEPAPGPAAPAMAVATNVETTTTAGCHPAYVECIPHHRGDALNCGDLSSSTKPVRLRDADRDPYDLDSNGDGVGCESS